MNNGINIGQFRGVNIVAYTVAFNGEFFKKYIEYALTQAPEGDLKNVTSVNIYDECPSYFPLIAMGGHYPATSEKGAELDIYLDQNLAHLLTDSPKGKVSSWFDGLFIKIYGRKFIVHTVLHELGHHVYDMNATPETKDDKEASEKYAEDYANAIYNKIYPRQRKYYALLNGIYHLLCWRRIQKDNDIRKRFNKSVHTDAE
jgi:hypothetical protein